jgi:hypothetical protein
VGSQACDGRACAEFAEKSSPIRASSAAIRHLQPRDSHELCHG